MEIINIEILDSIDSRIPTDQANTIAPLLSCEKAYWKPSAFGSRKRTVYTKIFFNTKKKDYCYFWTGFIPRIKEYLNQNNIPVEFYSQSHCNIELFYSDLLPIKLRSDQIQLLNQISEDKRGIILSPTGSGKTEILMGMLSSLPIDIKVLILSHSTSINKQTTDKIVEYHLGNVQMIGDGFKYFKFDKDIVISTIQSFAKIDPVEYIDYFDAVIIDETHHIRSSGKQYLKVLTHILAPIRIGFTATLPSDKESLLTMEGLLGPVIGEFSRKDAIEQGVIAMPKIKLIKLPYRHEIKELRTYKDVYEAGIVENKGRNRVILTEAKKYLDEGLSVIIMVNRIAHGEELERLCLTVFKIPTFFIQGATPQAVREQTKYEFINGDLSCLIVSSAWGEGINIPNANVLINAGGGKDELGVLQKIGRVLRKTDIKDSALIVDFFDSSHHYLISHFGERCCLYMEENWL